MAIVKSKKPKMIISDKIYVPYANVNRKLLKKHMRIDHFDDAACRRAGPEKSICDYITERPCDTCQACPNYGGRYTFFEEKEIKGKPYIGIAKGRRDLIEEIVGKRKKYRVIDKTVAVPMKHKLKFTGKPYDYQDDAVEDMLKTDHGVLKSKPRTGKTVMATMKTCKLRKKTIIIAHQDDLIDQFYGTFEDFTNLKKLQRKSGEDIVIIAKKTKDYLSGADVILTTYQKFIQSVGRKLLRKLSKTYGVVIVDEIHRGNANAYSQVLGTFKARYTYGMTATPKRKDGLDFVVNRIIGEVKHTTPANGLVPEVKVLRSHMNAKVSARRWDAICKALYKNGPRTKHIIKQCMKDLDKGHNIIIPVDNNRQAIDDYVKAINIAWMDHKNTTKQIAEPFYAYPRPQQKKDVLNRARSGKTRVIVGLRRMLLGVNVPRWSMIYEVSPINNEPNFEQEVERVCTPFADKPAPIIKFFVDVNVNASRNCFYASLRHSQNLGYIISKKTKKRIRKLAASSGSSQIASRSEMPTLIGRGKPIRV